MYFNQFEIFLNYDTLCKKFSFLIFMKKLCLWLFNLSRHAKQSKARKFYDISAKKQTNCVTSNTVFQPKFGNLLFKTDQKSSVHLFSNYKINEKCDYEQLRLWCTPSTPIYMWNQDPTGETSTFNLHELRNDMLREARLEFCLTWTMKINKNITEIICWGKQGWKMFELELWKLAKYYRNNMLSEARQKKGGGKFILFSAKGAEKVVLNKVRCGGGMVPLPPRIHSCWQYQSSGKHFLKHKKLKTD